MMVRVTFLPKNKVVNLYPGVTILELAIDNGIDIPSQCQMGTCSTCMVYVEKGEELIFENLNDDFYDSANPSKSILSCISELRDKIEEGEIVINTRRI